MKFLFVMYHPGYVRNNEPTLRALAQRGHDIVLGFNRAPRDPSDNLADTLAAEYRNISLRALPNRSDRWTETASFFRRCMDYLRYFNPAYGDALALRARIEQRLPAALRWTFVRLNLRDNSKRRASFHRILAAIEAAIPTDARIDAVLDAEKPDAVVVTPLVDFDSKQTDWIKSAQALGIPTCLAVFSWDNLTNKGHMRFVPDLVTVWNSLQMEEAENFHGVPRRQIRVTGAQCYDKWFEHQPSTGRGTFLQAIGLDPVKPMILYLCSSPFIGGTEEPLFVRDWLKALRSHGAPLSDAGVLVRPHPQNAAAWQDVELNEFGQVAIFPREGANPVDRRRQNDFFNSLYHSNVVIGINTSAMIEAGIVGRPVVTIRDSRFTHAQEGTLHFHHLVRCGLVHVADGIESSADLIARALGGTLLDKDRSDEFLQTFVRPWGLDQPATPRCLSAFEELGTIVPQAKPTRPFAAAAIRAMLAPIVLIAAPYQRQSATRAKAKKSKAQKQAKQTRRALATTESRRCLAHSLVA